MQFEFSGERELYIEIAEKYKRYIESGILADGEKLPSVRQAALDMGVNPNTVQRAYSLLESEGYLRSFAKKGAYVLGWAKEAAARETPDVRALIREIKKSGICRADLQSQIEEVFGDE